MKILTDAGCKVVYDVHECRVYFRDEIVWTGGKEPTTGLWVLPISTNSEMSSQDGNDDELLKLQLRTKEHMAANAYAMTSKEVLIRYLHQCLYSPTKKTLVKAIENNPLTTWPGLTAEAVRKHLPDLTPATDKVHMKRQPKGIQSTTKIPLTKTRKERLKDALEKIELDRDINPPQENEKTTRSPVIIE